MIVRTRNSPRVPQPSAGEGREHSVRSRPKVTLRTPKHGAVNTEVGNELREYLANQPRLVLIGVGGVARAFFHIPFHEVTNG